MVYDEVIDLLTHKGVAFKIHRHEAVVTVKEAEEKAPLLVGNLLKTVAFKVKDSFWVLAAVRCHDRIDYRKLAEALGVNRRQLRSLSPEEVEADLRFEIGGVGPIPLRGDVRAIFDSRLINAGKVCFGSGKNTFTLETEFSDLLRATGGETYAITRE